MDEYFDHHGLYVKQQSTGRSVYSSRRHQRGSILITSQPLGTVVLPSCRQEVCNYCFHRPHPPLENLQQCSQCRSAYFCDMACFKNGWLTYHQYVCRSNPPLDESLDLELLERVGLNCWRYNSKRQTHGGHKGEEGVQVTMEAFDSLLGNDATTGGSLVQIALARPYLKNTGLTLDDLTRYLGRFQCNNFDIHDDHLYTVGQGNYPIAALFNHSCRPNAVVVFNGSLLSIVAIEPITKDQEITIAYVDPAHDRQHRQTLLMDKYGFRCECTRCQQGDIDELLGNEAAEQEESLGLLRHGIPIRTPTGVFRTRILQQIEEWDLLEMCRLYDRRHGGTPDPTLPLNFATYTHFCIQFFAPYLWSTSNPAIFIGHRPSGPSTRALAYFDDPPPELAQPSVPKQYKDILSHVMKKIKLYPTNDLVPYHLELLTDATRLLYDEMKIGHWRNAVKLAMYVLIQYCWIYPPYHPILAQHLLLLAKCTWNSIIKSELQGKSLEMAYERGVRRWIMLSKETLAYTVGKNGEQWRQAIELEWIFLREQKLKE